MSSTTYATQQAAVAAAARPCNGLGRGVQVNAAVAMWPNSMSEFAKDITTKHTAQRLGGDPT